MKQLALDLAATPPATLQNFVVGRNGELVQNLLDVGAGAARERFVYAWGAAGCGRSHLLRATAAAVQARGSSALYIACGAVARLPEGAERMDFVALDDVDRLDAEQQIAIFHLYNSLRDRHRSLLAAGAVPPVQLQLREDLLTRLSWGLVYQVHALSDEEKAAALADQAARRGFRLAPEVCDYLLVRSRRDMPTLLATLDALDRYSLENKRPITVPLVRSLFAERGQTDTAAGIAGAREGD